MATNRSDTLDPALLRPGRLDRKIEFPMPDRRQKRLIFSTITAKMNLSEEVDLEDCILANRLVALGLPAHVHTTEYYCVYCTVSAFQLPCALGYKTDIVLLRAQLKYFCAKHMKTPG